MLRYEERIGNPARYYEQPSSILADEKLTIEERIIALKNWRDDITLKSIATEENMGAGDTATEPKDIGLVEEIDNILCFLE